MSVHDQMNGLITESQASGYGSLGFSVRGPGPDLADKFGRKFLGVSTAIDRMRDVVLVRSPFQVGRDIIGAIKVLVVHVREIFRVWDKGLSYQSRDQQGLLLTVAAQDKLPVSALIKRTNDKLATLDGDVVSPLVADLPLNASYSSKVRNFIKALKTNDWKPSFAKHPILLHCGQKYTTWRTMMQG